VVSPLAGSQVAALIEQIAVLQDIAEDAGVSIADARRVLAAAGRQRGQSVARLMGVEVSATRENRRAG
jgi:hypothetical protein